MTDIYEVLANCQKEALDRGIDFNLDIHFKDNSIPYADVKIYCSLTGDPSEAHLFNTTFSEEYCVSKNNNRLKKVQEFVSTVTLYSEQNADNNN